MCVCVVFTPCDPFLEACLIAAIAFAAGDELAMITSRNSLRNAKLGKDASLTMHIKWLISIAPIGKWITFFKTSDFSIFFECFEKIHQRLCSAKTSPSNSQSQIFLSWATHSRSNRKSGFATVTIVTGTVCHAWVIAFNFKLWFLF